MEPVMKGKMSSISDQDIIEAVRSGEGNRSANLRASACASAMLTVLKRNAVPAGICANRPKSAVITAAILG